MDTEGIEDKKNIYNRIAGLQTISAPRRGFDSSSPCAATRGAVGGRAGRGRSSSRMLEENDSVGE